MTHSRFRRGLDAVCRLFSWVSGGITLLIMFLVVAEVVMRDFFDATLGGTLEVSEVLLVFLVFAGVAYAQQAGDHVSTDLVTARLPDRVAAVIRTVGLVVAAAVILWLAWASLERGLASMETGEARFGIRSVPIWPARLMVPVGALLLGLQCLMSAADAWRGGAEAEAREEAATGPGTGDVVAGSVSDPAGR